MSSDEITIFRVKQMDMRGVAPCVIRSDGILKNICYHLMFYNLF